MQNNYCYVLSKLFGELREQLNPKHPLYRLADKIEWSNFQNAFSPLYSAYGGRPAKSLFKNIIIKQTLRDKQQNDYLCRQYELFEDVALQNAEICKLFISQLIKSLFKNIVCKLLGSW